MSQTRVGIHVRSLQVDIMTQNPVGKPALFLEKDLVRVHER